MKIASHVLFFNQEYWILKHIEMIAPFVDKIYVSWSELPWVYNPNARDLFRNKSNPEILKQSPYYDKIELITGVWNLEEDQRNVSLDAAIRDGMDYLLTIDLDEFYSQNDLKKIIDDIAANPDYDYYTTPWYTFWKDFKHVLINSNNQYISGVPEIGVNLHRNNRFVRCRRPSGGNIKQLTAICGHASYAITDEECWTKINTWGHANQFDVRGWYTNKWIGWNESTEDLHPLSPTAWKRAIKRPSEIILPEVLKEYI